MNVEVKVDVAGQLRLFKTVTFTDPYAFVDEALQNAQRAKATRVDVTITDTVIEFKDNGCGLSNPESLFTMSRTGWDADTVEDQNPFGLGFFSCVALASKILVSSKEFNLFFDVDKLINTGDTSIETLPSYGEEPIQGFRVQLTDLLDVYDSNKFEEKVRKVARHIVEFETYLNGEKIEAMDYTKTDGSPFAHVINVPGLKGWIRPVKKWYESTECKEIELYHQNRYVKEFVLDGIVGRVLVGRGELDFRAPDRRDIIENDKVEEFKKRLTTHIKRMLQVIVSTGTDEDIDKYQEVLDRYLTIEDYQEAMRYWILKDSDKVKKVEAMSDYDLRWMTVSDMRKLFAREESATEQPEAPSEFEVDDELIKASPTAGQHPINTSSGGYYGGGGSSSYTIKSSDIPKAMLNRPGESLEALKEKELLYYIEPKDLKTEAKRIIQAIEHHIPVVLVKNRLEIRVLKTVQNAKYLGTLEHKIVYKAKLKNPGPKDDRERRANRVFKLLSEVAGFPTNIFRIGTMDCVRNVVFGTVTVESRKSDTGIIRYGKVIFVDRKLIKRSKISEHYSDSLEVGDLFFLMNHMEDIAEYLFEAISEDRLKEKKKDTHSALKDEECIVVYKEQLPRKLSRENIAYHILEMLANNKVYDWLE